MSYQVIFHLGTENSNCASIGWRFLKLYNGLLVSMMSQSICWSYWTHCRRQSVTIQNTLSQSIFRSYWTHCPQQSVPFLSRLSSSIWTLVTFADQQNLEYLKRNKYITQTVCMPYCNCNPTFWCYVFTTFLCFQII